MDTRLPPPFIFIGEWFQHDACVTRTFVIRFYRADNAVEVCDKNTQKLFLRRTVMNDLSLNDLFVGAKVNFFGRQLTITDYADKYTKDCLYKSRKKTLLLVKNNILEYLGQILCALIDSNFFVSKGRMVHLNIEQVRAFLGERLKTDTESSALLDDLIQPLIALELVAENAVEKVKCCRLQSEIMRDNSEMAPAYMLFEKDALRHGVYCSPNDEYADWDASFFFKPKSVAINTLNLDNTTLGIIKPHCIKEGNLGKIVSEITSNGFKIMGLQMHTIERVNCEEFYDVYRGLIPEYIPMVSQLASGVCMALEIMNTDPCKNSFETFREFCGPLDPDIARLLRPNTLRAKFGKNKALNAIHCTDLLDDTFIELQYIFNTLDK